jgi:hypothetical protein
MEYLYNPEKYNVCIDCGEYKPDKIPRKGRVTGRCVDCAQKRLRDQQRSANKKNDQALRKLVIDHYGGVCRYCGESEFSKLQIDHMNGDGKVWRESIKSGHAGAVLWRWLKKTGFPEGYQVLCGKCNLMKTNMSDSEFKARLRKMLAYIRTHPNE